MNLPDVRSDDRSETYPTNLPLAHDGTGPYSRARGTAVAVRVAQDSAWRAHRRLIVLAAFVLLVAFNWLVAARAQAPVPAATQAVVSVAGTGVAYGSPDMAVIEVGVSVFGADVRTALSEADASMSAVRDAILAAGIAAEDIRTTSLNVWRDERTNPEGEVVIDRYQVSHSYQVQVRDVDTVGEVLAAAVDAGANSIGGISFTIADHAALATEARALAMADARAKAEQLADLAGVTLGAVTAITEAGASQPNGYPMAARFEMSAMSSVEGGQLAVTVTVTLTYAID
jgi:uncharacterized protein YggE